MKKKETIESSSYDAMDVPTLRSTVIAENKENKRRGRPPKALVNKKRKVGRPPGDKAIMDDYRRRFIASPKSEKVLNTILDAALDENHKHQGVAWKLCVERLMPLSSFDRNSGNQQPSISINISGVGEVDITNLEPLEGEYSDSLGGELEEDEDEY